MKKFLLAVALVTGFSSFASAAANRYSGALYVPVSRNAVADINLQNARFDMGRVSDTTTAKLIYTGAGRILSICTVGGTVATYSLGYDTAAIGSASAQVDGDPTILITPTVFSPGTIVSTTWTSQNRMVGCYEPKYPIPFSTGLVMVNSAIDAVTMVLYQKD